MSDPSEKNSHFSAERERALRILRSTLAELSDKIGIRNYSEYYETEHYQWRTWPELSPASNSPDMAEPTTATALFKRETPNDIVILIQINHHFGATWTEIPLLPMAIFCLQVWKFRLCQADANRMFNIVDEEVRAEAIDTLTSLQLSEMVMLLAITSSEVIGRAMYDSLNGLINQRIKPRFRRYWRALGIPNNFLLFPQLTAEIEELEAQSETFRKNWLQRTHGGARNLGGFLGRSDAYDIVDFIDHVRPLWKRVIKFFSEHDYDADCIKKIQSDRPFIRHSDGITVPTDLLKRVFRRRRTEATSSTIPKALQPLGLAISHARERFKVPQSDATVLKWYRSALKTRNAERYKEQFKKTLK